MKLTKRRLNQIIKEELKAVLNERVTQCEFRAKAAAKKAAYDAGDNYLNAKWDPLRDQLGKMPPNKAMPIRQALLNIWTNGWYKIIKDTYDKAKCVNYAYRSLEREHNSLKEWLLNPNGATTPKAIDRALNNALYYSFQ